MKTQKFHIYYGGEGDFLEVLFSEPAKEGTTEEIRKLKPHVKKQVVSGIVAWYRHPDSWDKSKN